MPHEPEYPSGTASAADCRQRLRWVLLAGMMVLIGVLLAVQFWRYRPPKALGLDAPAQLFSASRAVAALRVVLGDESPHPTGSPANHQVRDRIVATLRALGYAPEIQTGRACDEWSDCANVENIVARLDGQSSGPLVALAAHYDSVAAGPGASDDGIGIAAILEIARLLKAAPSPPDRPVLLLITDGEETGLLGARVFVERHPWAPQVKTVINLEARGNQGPSFMFETGSRNAEAMSRYPVRMSRLITNSIYYTAYKRLPNDTDFTVFKAAGWQGYNFALTVNVQHYHTPLDRIANLSLDSLQHHGDNAAAVLEALTRSRDTESDPASAELEGEAVYVDLLATRLLQWPVSLAIPMAAGSALLGIALFASVLHRRGLPLAGLLKAVGLAMFAMLLAALATHLLLMSLRGLAAIPPLAARYRWTAYPLPLDVAMVALTTLALLLTAALHGRITLIAWWAAIGLLLVLATLASAVLLPGLNFAVQLPLLALVLAAVPLAWPTRIDTQICLRISLMAATVTAVLVVVPTLGFLHQSLGPDALVVAAALLAWVFLPMMGLLAELGLRCRRRLLLATSVVAVATAMTAAALPPYSATSPQRVNLEYLLDADRGVAEWLISPDSGQLPAALASAVVPSRRSAAALPWFRGPVWRADAPLVDLAGPQLQLVGATAEGAAVRYRIHLRSRRGAHSISLCWPSTLGLTEIEVAGQRLSEPDSETLQIMRRRHGEWRCVSDHTLPAEGLALSFRSPSPAAFELLLTDRSSGIPASGRALLDARRSDMAAPSQDGDVTRLLRRCPVSPERILR